MIGQLRGRLADKRPNQVLVDVGGVGYLVQVPLSTFASLGELHTEVTLLIHTHVREDAFSLYGFLSSREKHFFELLLSASGVGPSLALKILSGMSVEELVPAIRGGDLARLTRIPGVGRKTANVVLNNAFGQPTVAVDTHVFRVANRTGLAPGKDPREVEDRLMKFTPPEFLHHAHHWLILHGRYVCLARNPGCPQCVIRDLCEFKQKTKDV